MRLSKCVRLLVLAVGLVLISGGTARSQVNTADLLGHVLDPQGLAVVGAKVTVENLATGAARTADADERAGIALSGFRQDATS